MSVCVYRNTKIISTSYTPKGIGLHTDNPYRDPMPDFQLLHQIDGCECPNDRYPCPPKCNVPNQFVDAFAVALHLRETDFEAFRLLTEVGAVAFERISRRSGC